MSTTNNVSYSIDLNGVPENDATREVFLVAARTGDDAVLDTVDAVSYFLYLDRFENCAKDDFCEDKISRLDMRGQPYASGDVARRLAELPQSKQAEIWRRAVAFMGSANDVVSRDRVK